MSDIETRMFEKDSRIMEDYTKAGLSMVEKIAQEMSERDEMLGTKQRAAHGPGLKEFARDLLKLKNDLHTGLSAFKATTNAVRSLIDVSLSSK